MQPFMFDVVWKVSVCLVKGSHSHNNRTDGHQDYKTLKTDYSQVFHTNYLVYVNLPTEIKVTHMQPPINKYLYLLILYLLILLDI